MKKEITREQYLMYDSPSETWSSKLQSYMHRVLAFFYKMLWMVSKQNEVGEKKYNVSICAIFKNEAQYLKEWIEFHKIVGVEHFYMYNNNSTDDFDTTLKPYIEEGVITLVDWPYDQAQMKAYKHCIEKYSSETKWMGFIDIDEFVVPKHEDDIYSFLQHFEKKRGAVKIYWKMFGTSGLIDRDMNGLVSEDFTVCWPKHYDVGKCFYNTAYDFRPSSKKNSFIHHSFWANWKGIDLPPVNVFDKVAYGTVNKIPNGDFPIQINHYFTKSYMEYAMKRSKGDVYFKENPHDEEYFYNHERLCETVDYSAYKYLIKLKLAMKVKEDVGSNS